MEPLPLGNVRLMGTKVKPQDDGSEMVEILLKGDEIVIKMLVNPFSPLLAIVAKRSVDLVALPAGETEKTLDRVVAELRAAAGAHLSDRLGIDLRKD
jgi:hypothetical protein